MASMEERYIASMVLCGTGDAMGYYRGRIEFCTNIKKIQKMVDKLSSGKGVMALDISGPDWIVSDGKRLFPYTLSFIPLLHISFATHFLFIIIIIIITKTL